MEIKLDIPKGYKPEITEQEDGYLLRIFEPKEEPKFKRGDIIFVSDRNNLNEAICIIKEIKDESNGYYYHAMFNTINRFLFTNYNMANVWKEERLATPKEQQILFTALAKDGKRWNTETLELEDILKVPENIKLYQPKKNDDQIYIGFEHRQMLGVGQMLGVYNGAWHVMINDKDVPCEPIQCELIPCKREDLKVGDTAFCIHEGVNLRQSMNERFNYCKIRSAHDHTYTAGGNITTSANRCEVWYKVVPIKE